MQQGRGTLPRGHDGASSGAQLDVAVGTESRDFESYFVHVRHERDGIALGA
jgi:hypothetical protein